MKNKIITIDDLSNFAYEAQGWAFEAKEKTQEFFDKLPDSRNDELLKALKELKEEYQYELRSSGKQHAKPGLPIFKSVLKRVNQLIQKYEVEG